MLAGLLFVALAQLSFGSEEVRSTSTAQYYCGTKLTNSLSLLCEGVYKRHDPEISNNFLDYEEPPSTEFDSENLPSIFREKQEALSMTTKRLFRDRRSGVVNECCRKPCTISELSSYCGETDV